MNKEELEKYCAKNGPHAQLGNGYVMPNDFEFSKYYRYVGPPRSTAEEATKDAEFILDAVKRMPLLLQLAMNATELLDNYCKECPDCCDDGPEEYLRESLEAIRRCGNDT